MKPTDEILPDAFKLFTPTVFINVSIEFDKLKLGDAYGEPLEVLKVATAPNPEKEEPDVVEFIIASFKWGDDEIVGEKTLYKFHLEILGT